MKSIAIVLFIACTAAAITKEQVDAIVQPAAEVAHLDRVAVGVIGAGGRAVYGYGKVPADGKTVFEIGSITKVFTATMLADMVQRGEVRLEQPVRELLPADVKVPSKDGVEITLLHLTNQTSGLPRIPDNMELEEELVNPYARYTPEKMYEALAAIELSRRPGDKYAYSNLGVGLLGHALSLKAGKSYEQLLIERICTPLGMKDTRLTLDDELRKRLAAGRDVAGVPMANWDFDALAGAGAIRSTVDDMLIFLAANLEIVDSPLSAAMEMTHERRAHAGGTIDIAMGWHIGTRTGARWHNGQTGGYHSFAAYVADKKIGVVVLCNTGGGMVDLIGTQLVQAMLGEPVEPVRLKD